MIYGINYPNIQDDYRIIFFSNYIEIFNKLREIKNLKRILIRTHSFSMRCLEYHFEIDELFQNCFKYKIQFSHIPISNNLMKSIELISKVNSLILNSNNSQIIYNMVKHFKNSFEKLYFNSEKIPIKELSGIYNNSNNNNNYNNISNGLLNSNIEIDGFNHLKNIKYIEVLNNINFENLNIIIKSIPNLKELNIIICFNHLLFSLSNETHMKYLGFKSDYYCIGGCCESDTNDKRVLNSYNKKKDILEYYDSLLESFKNCNSLNKVILNHGCTVYKNRMDSSDVINNKHIDKYYLSFLDNFTKLINVIPQLNQFEINGINNPVIFKYLIRKLNNKTIQHYKQTIGFSWIPDCRYDKLFESLIKEYNHIETFKYYDQSISRNRGIYFNFKR